MPENKTLMSRSDLVRRGIEYSNSHMLYLEKIGSFPKRMRITPQCIRWDASEIESFLASKSAARVGGKNV